MNMHAWVRLVIVQFWSSRLLNKPAVHWTIYHRWVQTYMFLGGAKSEKEKQRGLGRYSIFRLEFSFVLFFLEGRLGAVASVLSPQCPGCTCAHCFRVYFVGAVLHCYTFGGTWRGTKEVWRLIGTDPGPGRRHGIFWKLSALVLTLYRTK